MSNWTKDDEIQSGMMNSVWAREKELQKRVAELERRVAALEQLLTQLTANKFAGSN